MLILDKVPAYCLVKHQYDHWPPPSLYRDPDSANIIIDSKEVDLPTLQSKIRDNTFVMKHLPKLLIVRASDDLDGLLKTSLKLQRYSEDEPVSYLARAVIGFGNDVLNEARDYARAIHLPYNTGKAHIPMYGTVDKKTIFSDEQKAVEEGVYGMPTWCILYGYKKYQDFI